MTKQEWIDNICDFDDLISFCNHNGYEEWTENYYDDNDYDRAVDEDISDREGGWWDLRDYLNSLPNSRRGSFYRRDGWFDYTELSQADLNSDIIALADRLEEDGFFAEEEPEEQEEEDWWPDFVRECAPPDPEPDFDKLDMTSFMKFCGEAAVTVRPVPA